MVVAVLARLCFSNMDASTSNDGGAQEGENSANKAADSDTAEFCPGFKDVDAFVKVCIRFCVLVFCSLPCLERYFGGDGRKNSNVGRFAFVMRIRQGGWKTDIFAHLTALILSVSDTSE